MSAEKSRYRVVQTYTCQDRRGRQVQVYCAAKLDHETLRGYHQLRQGERLDHLAAQYLSDPMAFWRIAALNGVMLPEALSEQAEIAIPQPISLKPF